MRKNDKNLTNIFKALADKNRLKILLFISKHECKCRENKFSCWNETCIKDLKKQLKITMPTISHHIKKLVNAGFVNTKKEGKWVYCVINKEKFKEANKFLKQFIN
ncbi:MAG TPA: metalloregulator ArsR/SmtB family transcription factor [bacterium]|mgnify:FL=1|jgi:ArsR family transcriptional regulator|nr:metalloregulator ArsR/SmtB family transcription factor [bacterium]HRV05236.1 metalloregulator ArsR/SmtB family transcription factor [Candidatus Ratteibacteria bacterium]